ncbi:hypothetical protein [Alkalicoccus halolimnae]|uniref:Uncharacterized protein n=1 Tax=Alkalicoccus halolimnae TaxID=1667239 RepID=A0A5C7EZC7_9BACI|nr:hypothetical protein [Alkalicoccus halolimnae]TXF81568.1 hypothetical protein FTX54_15740 [Alkalicoccus halolimnae]
MKGRKASFLIDFSQVKKNRQKMYWQEAEALYEKLFYYIQFEMNLREKVRAKAMFRDLCGIDGERKLTSEEEIHFEHWLLFDYITVIGSRPFDLFVRAKKEEMSKQMTETAGLLMLMYLAPYRVKENRETTLVVEDISGKQLEAHPLGIPPKTRPGDLIFARITAVGFLHTLIGPVIRIPMDEEANVNALLEKKRQEGKKNYHRFLKETGISFLRYHSSEDA